MYVRSVKQFVLRESTWRPRLAMTRRQNLGVPKRFHFSEV
jgi:hypothetical protein